MAPRQPVPVTGGAGYIGSHVVRWLGAAGYPVAAYDGLSTGLPWAALDAELIVGDLAEPARPAPRFGAVMPRPAPAGAPTFMWTITPRPVSTPSTARRAVAFRPCSIAATATATLGAR
ncbi:MAG: NAD-dependent epimerase/dehydratase family protein [Geminicoccaceae bacterium]